jgi:hypothetical protein
LVSQPLEPPGQFAETTHPVTGPVKIQFGAVDSPFPPVILDEFNSAILDFVKLNLLIPNFCFFMILVLRFKNSNEE